ISEGPQDHLSAIVGRDTFEPRLEASSRHEEHGRTSAQRVVRPCLPAAGEALERAAMGEVVADRTRRRPPLDRTRHILVIAYQRCDHVDLDRTAVLDRPLPPTPLPDDR